MKIALISLYLPSGSKIGVGYQVHGLANALVRRGHAVTVLSPCPQPVDARYVVEVVPERKPLSTFRFPWQLREIDFSRFDVLNAHGDDWFLWGKRRPRHVHTYHGAMLAEMIYIHGLKERLRMAMLAICEQQSVLLPDETVAVSENTRRYVKGIRHVIPCGVDVERFHPGKTADKSPNPALLFVGTMHGRKRGRWLVDLFHQKVRKHIPHAELWCVCDRPRDMEPLEGVTFWGRVDEVTLINMYRRAWAFCLPSTYEGFGVPYIEAMASGLPVVATPNVGAREVTREGTDGVLAKDEELASELIEMLSDTGKREQFRHAGLLRSLDFSWNTVCERYEMLYTTKQSRPTEACTTSS